MSLTQAEKRIRVRKETATVGLGHVIVSSVNNGEVVVLQAVAAAAVNQSVKAIGVANQILGRVGMMVSAVITFEDAPARDAGEPMISRMDFRLVLEPAFT